MQEVGAASSDVRVGGALQQTPKVTQLPPPLDVHRAGASASRQLQVRRLALESESTLRRVNDICSNASVPTDRQCAADRLEGVKGRVRAPEALKLAGLIEPLCML